MNCGWVQIMGPRRARRSSSRRSRRATAVLRAAADPLAADEHRRYGGRGALAPRSCFRARTTAIPSSAGSSRSRRPASASCTAARSGQQYQGDLFMGGARDFLFRAGTSSASRSRGNRRMVGVDDPRLEDRVADNLAKFEVTESESLVFGQNFGLTTDILTGAEREPVRPLEHTRRALRGLPAGEVARPGIRGARAERPRPSSSLLVLERREHAELRRAPSPTTDHEDLPR